MKLILLALFFPVMLALVFGKLFLLGTFLALKTLLAGAVFLVPFLLGYAVGKSAGSRTAAASPEPPATPSPA